MQSIRICRMRLCRGGKPASGEQLHLQTRWRSHRLPTMFWWRRWRSDWWSSWIIERRALIIFNSEWMCETANVLPSLSVKPMLDPWICVIYTLRVECLWRSNCNRGTQRHALSGSRSISLNETFTARCRWQGRTKVEQRRFSAGEKFYGAGAAGGGCRPLWGTTRLSNMDG